MKTWNQGETFIFFFFIPSGMKCVEANIKMLKICEQFQNIQSVQTFLLFLLKDQEIIVMAVWRPQFCRSISSWTWLIKIERRLGKNGKFFFLIFFLAS